MVLDRALNRDEMAFAGPVPDEGDVHEQLLKGIWCVDNQWITLELLAGGRAQEMEYKKKHGVYGVVIEEEECKRHQGKPYTLKWVDNLKGDGCRSSLVVREIKRAKTKVTQLGAEAQKLEQGGNPFGEGVSSHVLRHIRAGRNGTRFVSWRRPCGGYFAKETGGVW